MTKFDQPIRKLLSGAQANTKENRAHIFHHVAGLLRKSNDIEARDDIRLLVEIYDALAPNVDVPIRQVLAREVAAQPFGVAPELIERLATDSARVAAPILKRAAIDDAILLRIIKHTGKAHHLLIAERAELSPAVWDELSGVGPKQEDLEMAIEPATAMSGKATRGRPGFAKDDEFPALKALADLAAEAGVADQQQRPMERQNQPPAHAEADTRRIDAADDFPRKLILPTGPGSDPGPQPIMPNEPSPQLPPEQLETDGFDWVTDRQGRIVSISDGASRAFGRAAATLRGLYFFTLVEPVGGSSTANLGRILTRHLPIRDTRVEIEADQNRRAIWCLSAHASFDRKTGRFTGYEGNATPLEQGGADNKPADAERIASQDSGLVEHLCQEARGPTGELLTAAELLYRKARENSDRATMSELLTMLDAGYRVKSMIEDMEACRLVGSTVGKLRKSSFSIRATVSGCLQEDAARHGGLSRFKLEDDAADAQIHFDENLVRRSLLRAFELVRARGGHVLHPGVTIELGDGGRIDVGIPTGTGGNYDNPATILFSPTEAMAKIGSSVVAKRGPVFSVEFGLSIAREQIRSSGGDVRLEFMSDDQRMVILSFPLGR